jgi:hypothetical protein
MKNRRHPALAPPLLLAITLFVAMPAYAQDPAQPGVCYATLGNFASSPGGLISIDTGTGAGTLIGPTGITGDFGDPGVPALAIKTTGEMYAMDINVGANLYRVDATTGAATEVAATTLNSPTAIAFNGLDILWAVDISGDLHVVNETTGASTLVGATGRFIKGLAFDPADGALWGTDGSGGVFTIDIHTGAATLVGNTGLPASPDICFDAAGNLFGSSGGGLSANNLISIDKSTGQGTVVGPIGFSAVAGMAQRLDRLVPVALGSWHSRVVGRTVEISWELTGVEGEISFEVARTGDYGVVRVDESTIARDGARYTLVDDQVSHGGTYTYRVGVIENRQPVAAFETVVVVPALQAALEQNYPNPFNPRTTIAFTLETVARVTLSVYDAQGRRVTTLVDAVRPAGVHEAAWNGTDAAGNPVSSGVYLYRLKAGNTVLSKRMVLLK